MNVEEGSIMAFFYEQFPVKVYTKGVPENFEKPSMYFPPSYSFDSNDTNMTFMKTYMMIVKLFERDSRKAHSEAERVADSIRTRRNVIPLIDPGGEQTGYSVRFTRVEVRVADDGVADIILHWDSRYHYHRETYKAAEFISVESGVKGQ